MRTALAGITAVSCVLLFGLFAAAQDKPKVSENLCDPEAYFALLHEERVAALDSQETEYDEFELRIELLERGFNPGFDQGFESDRVLAKTQLRQALAEFQAEIGLPITGQIDSATLMTLGFPIPKSGLEGFDQMPQRAKPSK